MTLAIGSRLGPYEILAPIGAGGMGEVYRALDTRLGREVAVKTLPAKLAADPERLRRFEAEARAASALNHPNIVTIHEIEHEGSVAYIVMELVEGKTLRETLASAPMPVRKLLPLACQIADGLAKAHEAGIVHRDLKPENIMVNRDGRVKILDFGLAKLARKSFSPGTESQVATVDGVTEPGAVLGSVGYMSPEQARAGAADYRADQFSFGAVLYEMATGTRAFQRATSVETLSAILREDPKTVATINPAAPAPLRWVIERCLAKEPEKRYASTADLAHDLEDLRDRLSEVEHTGISGLPVSGAKGRWGRLGAAVLVAGFLVLASLVSFQTGKDFATREISPPSFRQLTFRRGNITAARFLPDGESIIYSAAWDGNPVQLFSKQLKLEGPQAQPLLPISAGLLSVSSSGELAISLRCSFHWGRCNMGTLARFTPGGGAPRDLQDDVDECDWAPDGSFAVVRRSGGKQQLEFPQGKVLYEAPGWISNARISPKGDRIAFVEHPVLADLRGSIAVVDLDGKKTTLSDEWKYLQALAWHPDGREIWFSGNPKSNPELSHAISLAGKVRPILNVPGNTWVHDISRNGRRLLITVGSPSTRVLGLAIGSSQERNLSWFDWSTAADLSADGKTLLFYEWGRAAAGKYTVYLRQTDGSEPTELGNGKALALSPDGRWALALEMTSPPQLVLLPTGAGTPRRLARGRIEEYYSAMWFPHGKQIVFNGKEPGKRQSAFVQDIEGGEPRQLTEEDKFAVLIAPDAKRMVVLADRYLLFSLESRKYTELPGLEPEEHPIQWSADGRALYLRTSGDFEARVDRLDLATGKRVPLQEIRPSDPAGVIGMQVEPRGVLVTPDGRFIVYTYWQVAHDLYLAEGLK